MINVVVLSLPFRGCYGIVNLTADTLFIGEASAQKALKQAGINPNGTKVLPRTELGTVKLKLPASKIDWVQIPK